MNDAYIPAPSRNADAFVVHTPRIRIIVMSISGFLLRTSTAIQSDRDRDPTASRPSVFGDPQPHVVVSRSRSARSRCQLVISAAASQLMRPGSFTGDSGMKRHVATAAKTVGISGSQNSQ